MSATLTFARNDCATFVNIYEEGYEFNVANANACAILAALGYSTDLWEVTLTVQELLASCERYLTSDIAQLVDGGKEPEIFLGSGATVLDMGRRAGYLTEKVREIARLCSLAIEAGAENVYFS